MIWILLVLVAQLAWAFENYLDRYLLTRFKAHTESETGVGTLVLISAFFYIIVAGFVLSLALVLANHGIITITPFDLSTQDRLMAMFVGVLEILWLIPYLHALDMSDETQAPPLFQMTPIFGFILGLMFFHEVPTMIHVIASAIIVIGSVLLNTTWHRTERKARINIRVIALMMLASFIIALAAFLFKGTALEGNFWGTAFWMSLGGFLTGCLLWGIVPRYRDDFNAFVKKRDKVGVALNITNEIMDNVSLLAFYGAIVIGPSVTLVQATVAYQPVFILFIGILAARFGSSFHAERLSGVGLLQRILGITVIVLGSILIFV